MQPSGNLRGMYCFGQEKNMNSKQDRMRDKYNFSAITILLKTISKVESYYSPIRKIILHFLKSSIKPLKEE